LPEGVLKYKTKGINTKKTKKGYAQYRGHSERGPKKGSCIELIIMIES